MKFIRYGILMLAAALAGCATLPMQEANNDLPKEVVEWAQKNVYQVLANGGTGSGFWVSPDTFVTACHVVNGETHAALINQETTRLFIMTVKSCDKGSDVAILKRAFGEEDWTTDRTEITTVAPKQGDTVYGAGHPLGMQLVITKGHYQFKITDVNAPENRHLITAHTIMGDSGSPVLIVENGVVKVVGIRLAIRIIPAGFVGRDHLPNMVLMSDGKTIVKELHK